MGLRIGIDCDSVLRDFIPDLVGHIKKDYPKYKNLIKEANDWEWESWLPFWTEEQTEGYVFTRKYYQLFGPDASPIQSSVEDWPKLKEWAEENGHELVLVSAQREHCEEPTNEWLEKHGFDFKEIHYTQDKWAVDVDILIDDSPSKLKKFNERSVNYGKAICYKQPWNQHCQNSTMSIDRLSDIIGKVFG